MQHIKILGQSVFLDIIHYGGDSIKIEIWNNNFQISTHIKPDELEKFQAEFNKETNIVLEAVKLEKTHG